MEKFKISIGWKSTLLTVIVVPLCFSLGLWQLQRADEKASIAEAYAQRNSMAALDLSQVDAIEDKTNLPVVVEGKFMGQHLLLENQWRNKQLGLEVLSLFETVNGEKVLLNRGWLANKDRSTMPQFETPSETLKLQATIYQPSKEPYSLGQLILDSELNVQRLSYLDISQISHAFDTTFYPLSLRLKPDAPHGFDTNWPEINVKPETHIGYAVQWFLFAALAFIVFIFANSNLGTLIRKRDK
jgi:cytochrome oxidase assembly protein ShyY1